MILNPLLDHVFLVLKPAHFLHANHNVKNSFVIMRSLMGAKQIPGCCKNQMVYFLTLVCNFIRITRKKRQNLVKTGDSRSHPKILIGSVFGGAREFECLHAPRESLIISCSKVAVLASQSWMLASRTDILLMG